MVDSRPAASYFVRLLNERDNPRTTPEDDDVPFPAVAPDDAKMTSALLIFLIRVYRWTVSPLLRALCGGGCGCRFEPSCSQYCLEAVQRHGAARGLALGLKRIARCHPWGGSGYDPVPETLNSRS
jgi:putative membrane protein insertion efficiency factor